MDTAINADPALSMWYRNLITLFTAFEDPLVRGTLTNPGWGDGEKDELLLAYKPPPDVAASLASWSSRLANHMLLPPIGGPVAMSFPAAAIHSTVAVIRIPPQLSHVITLGELGDDLIGPTFVNVAERWISDHPDPLMVHYDRLKANRQVVMAWPHTTGALFGLRTTLIEALQDYLWKRLPGLGDIQIRGSWAEHITLIRFLRALPRTSTRLLALRDTLAEWNPAETRPFAMGSIELSRVRSAGGTICLDPVAVVGLPGE